MNKLRFALILAATAAMLITSGCSSTNFERGDFKASNHRLFWKTEGLDVQFSSKPDGTVEASAKIKGSGTNADALNAAVDSVISKLEKASTGK